MTALFKINLRFILLWLIISIIGADTLYAIGITIPSASKININNGELHVKGDLNIRGTLTASSANAVSIKVSAIWLNTGSFDRGSSTVNLNGANQSITGNTTFFTLTKTTTSADTLTFGSGTTQTITNNLTFQGASGNLLSLRSSSDGQQFNLFLLSGGTASLSFLDVKDSNASGGQRLLPTNSVDSGNNTNWFPPTPPPPPEEEVRRPTPTPTPTPVPLQSPTATPIESPTVTPILLTTPTPVPGLSPTPLPSPAPTITPPKPLIPGSISGNVVDDNKQPVNGIKIDAFEFIRGNLINSSLTNESGDYTISGLIPGDYRIGVDASGTPFGSKFFDRADFDTAVPVPVTAGNNTPFINFILSKGIFIRGNVTDASGSPVPSIFVDAFDADTGDLVNDDLTDGKADYSIAVSPGRYKVGVNTFGTDFLTEFFDDSAVFKKAKIVEVASDKSAEDIDFILSKGVFIRGRVTDISHNPISDLFVNVFDGLTDEFVNSGITDKNGDYSVRVGPGIYRVIVDTSGKPFASALKDNIVVESGSDTEGVNFILFGHNSIEGRVSDSKGMPMPEMFVKVFNLDTTAFIGFDITDEGGNYSVAVPAGMYSVVVDTRATNLAPVSKDVIISGSDIRVDFVLLASNFIRGKVMDSLNNPVQGIKVEAFAFDAGFSIGSGITDEDGDYSIAVPPGRYKVGIDTSGTGLAPVFFDDTDSGYLTLTKDSPVNSIIIL